MHLRCELPDLCGWQQQVRTWTPLTNVIHIAMLFNNFNISFLVFELSSRTTRGFRAGSKLLSTAAMLDTFVVGLRLMQYIYAYQFLSARWWMKYTQTNADWCIFYSGALLHSLALQLYGLAAFYMEAYHDEGTFEEWSWLILGLFSLAALFGTSLEEKINWPTLWVTQSYQAQDLLLNFLFSFSEFLLVFTGFGAFYTVIELLALLAAVIWSFSFEPLLHYYSPVFHDRDLNADIPIGEEEEERIPHLPQTTKYS